MCATTTTTTTITHTHTHTSPICSNSSKKPLLQAWGLINTNVIKRDCRRRTKIDGDQRCLVALICTVFINDTLWNKKMGETLDVTTIQELQRAWNVKGTHCENMPHPAVDASWTALSQWPLWDLLEAARQEMENVKHVWCFHCEIREALAQQGAVKSFYWHNALEECGINIRSKRGLGYTSLIGDLWAPVSVSVVRS